jgi:hypothetical protein
MKRWSWSILRDHDILSLTGRRPIFGGQLPFACRLQQRMRQSLKIKILALISSYADTAGHRCIVRVVSGLSYRRAVLLSRVSKGRPRRSIARTR